jgi:hypothetical protein
LELKSIKKSENLGTLRTGFPMQNFRKSSKGTLRESRKTRFRKR